MRMFLILLPFAALSALLAIAPPVVATLTAALLASVLMLADAWRGRSLKLLHATTVILLVAVGVYGLAIDPHVSGNAAHVTLDAGLLMAVLIMLAAGRPFTSQYGRETVDASVAARPDFHRANQILTGVWIVAFVIMLIADIGVIYLPWLPAWAGVVAAVAARNGAAWFTQGYAARRRRIGEAAGAATPHPNAGKLA